MKRTLLLLTFILVLALSFAAWRLLGSATAFGDDTYYLYIRTGMTYEQVLDQMKQDTVLASPGFFRWTAQRFDYPANVKAGKYEIKKDMNILGILRLLKNGRQTPVHLTILKLRTPEGFSSMIGKKFECDSASMFRFLHNNDSLREFGVDSNTWMTLVQPNTYSYFWNVSASGLLRKMYAASKAWWTPTRIQEAQAKGLTPVTANILASIVEEETNAQQDKGKIASVYLNRLAKGIKLGADPTIKFAMRNFELKEIYFNYLHVESPYNTYEHSGLPPGPICTPSTATLEAVLQSPSTDYLYFVAKPDFSGYSNFAATYKEHLAFANEWREALKKEKTIRAAQDSAKKSGESKK